MHKHNRIKVVVAVIAIVIGMVLYKDRFEKRKEADDRKKRTTTKLN